jgi:hypothetical protein
MASSSPLRPWLNPWFVKAQWWLVKPNCPPLLGLKYPQISVLTTSLPRTHAVIDTKDRWVAQVVLHPVWLDIYGWTRRCA